MRKRLKAVFRDLLETVSLSAEPETRDICRQAWEALY
jgi:hypothetical protein